MTRQKVKDNPGLERDMTSNAVINTNKNAFAIRREQKSAQVQKELEFETMKAEIAELKKIVNKLSK